MTRMYRIQTLSAGPMRETQIPVMFDLLNAKEGEVILDAGCEKGGITSRIANTTQVIGIEVRRINRISWIRMKSTHGHQAEFIVCDVQKLPFQEGIFDKILCSSVLQHIPDHITALREFKRVLKGGGFIVLNVPSYNIFLFLTSFSRIINIISKIKRNLHVDPANLRKRIFSYFKLRHMYDKRTIEKLLEKNGFEIRKLIWTPSPFFQLFYELNLLLDFQWKWKLPSFLMYFLVEVECRLPKLVRSAEFTLLAESVSVAL